VGVAQLGGMLQISAMANEFARALRRNATPAERALWSQLRLLKERGFHFRRQAPVGRYIADFAEFKVRLIIEVDGSQHDGSLHDVLRDKWFAGEGFRVMRFWNCDVLANLEGVTDSIHHVLGLMEPPSPDAPPPPLIPPHTR
jgi:very-short-patch-repair endonuclease